MGLCDSVGLCESLCVMCVACLCVWLCEAVGLCESLCVMCVGCLCVWLCETVGVCVELCGRVCSGCDWLGDSVWLCFGCILAV